MPETSPFEEASQSRLNDFGAWLAGFQAIEKLSGKIAPIENAALLLNNFYWSVVQAYVRPLLDRADQEDNSSHHLINRFKIISITELSIMAVLPFDVIDHDKGLLDEEINARFAWYCAITILTGWDESIEQVNLEKIIRYHC